MKRDDAERALFDSIKAPPLYGLGSSREAWITFALKVMEANKGLCETIDKQSALIKQLREAMVAQSAESSRELFVGHDGIEGGGSDG